jgi:hypothetical protein
MFGLLWRNRKRKEPTKGEELWVKVWKEKASDYKPLESSGERIRAHRTTLGRALKDYCRANQTEWVIRLLPGGPKRGYRLEWFKRDDPQSATLAFWRAHLNPPRDVYIVYPEQLFYQDWSDNMVFRCYGLDSEQPEQALAELKRLRPDMYKDGLVVAYPFVACGDIEARDLITDWFAQHTLVEVQKAITRRMDDRAIVEGSLILLGAAPGNRIIADVLRSHACQHLAFRLIERGPDTERHTPGRLLVKNPTIEELDRLAPYSPESSSGDCTIQFRPDKGAVLAIVTRVPNLYSDTTITIINSGFSRAVEQLARFLTNEEHVRSLVKQIGAHETLPASFQVLFAMPVHSLANDHRPAQLVPLAWRIY